MLSKAKGFLRGGDLQNLVKQRTLSMGMDEETANFMVADADKISTSFKPVTGALLRADQMRLSKLLYRATRGMAWVQFFDIDEPLDDFYGMELDLCIYFVIYPANIQNLKTKIERICGSFN
jgi:V-type ATPase 116kDa subunit family